MCAMKTDPKRVDWCRRYQMAMRRFLQQDTSASLLPAARVGRQAVTLGLETLDVANYHKLALTALAPRGSTPRTTRHKTTARAKIFFAAVIVPIEATHRAALKAEIRIAELTRTLRQRSHESSVSARRHQRAIARRQAAEAVLKKNADRHAKLLAEAQRLQNRLRRQAHELLSAQENERQKTGRELRNEVSQTLLAIDLSLLALKTSAGGDTERLEKELANAERMVGQFFRRGSERDRVKNQ